MPKEKKPEPRDMSQEDSVLEKMQTSPHETPENTSEDDDKPEQPRVGRISSN